MQHGGTGVNLRPWMLSFKPDAGFKGYAEFVVCSDLHVPFFLKSNAMVAMLPGHGPDR